MIFFGVFFWRNSVFREIVRGIEREFMERLVMVRFLIRILEFFCNFFIFFIVMIISMFKNMISG